MLVTLELISVLVVVALIWLTVKHPKYDLIILALFVAAFLFTLAFNPLSPGRLR
jgi:hypothetical protein